MSAAAGDPLLLAGAAAALSLFPRTLGPASAVSAASPSKVHETLLRDISQSLLQKGSKEMVEQASQAIKSHGDIRKLYQDDGAKAAMVNGKNNNQGRRPALGRKRAPFSLKITTSDSVQNVDFSVLENIDDPEEYFLAVERLEKADKEMKRLRGGEVPTESVENHQTRKERKSRPGILGRKSVYSYQFSVGDDISNAFEGPASQRGTSTQSRFIEEDLNVLSPENAKQLVTSSSSQPELPGASERKDPISEKDSGITLDHLLSSFKNLDEVEEENLLREILQLKETSRGKVCLPEFNIPGDRPLGSIASWNNPISGRTPERPISGSHLARISKLERRISLGDALKDNYVDISKDDDSEGSPEIVRDKQSPRAHSSSDEIVLMTGETSTAKVMDEERPNESVGSPEHALGPEQNILNDVMIGERQAGNSPIGVYIARAVSKEKNAFDGHNFSLEGDGVPLDSPIIEKSSNKTEVSSSHNLRANSTEALASARCRNVDPGSRPDTGRTSHAVDDNSQNEVPVAAQKVVEGDDKATCPLEIPPADIDPENQPHMQDENIEQQQQTVGTSNALSPSIGKKQKAAQKGRNKKKKELNGRKSLSDAGLVWQSGVRRSTRVRSRPLQDWLGERFLYGRIHNTMATVIGVKSYSPSQDGKKPTMRVKSFVSEQYADLVAQAAKY